MRIGINLINFSQDRFGGVEQYVKNLIWHLANSRDKVKLFLFLTRPHRDIFPDHHEQIKRVMFKEVNPDKIYEAIHHCQLDLWFSPLHRSFIPNIPVPTVVTIHDVLHTSYPQFVSENLDWHNQYYQQFTPFTDAIITVSNFSKNTLIQFLQIPDEKIHAIHLDSPLIFESMPNEILKAKIKEKYDLPDDYAIYPASYNPHKNHMNLLKAILTLRDQYKKQVPLVLTGYTYKGNMVYQSIVQFLEKHRLENQVKIVGYIPPEEMPYLFLNANFLVFPSLYEGFGIPLVEAMKTQCPIVCSNRGSIPEVVGEAGLQFNPEDPNEIAMQILKVLNPQTRLELIEKGNERAKLFSWKKNAQETLHVFQSICKGEKNDEKNACP